MSLYQSSVAVAVRRRVCGGVFLGSHPGHPGPAGVPAFGVGGFAAVGYPALVTGGRWVGRSEEQVVGKCMHDLVSGGGITLLRRIALLEITVARDGASESEGVLEPECGF